MLRLTDGDVARAYAVATKAHRKLTKYTQDMERAISTEVLREVMREPGRFPNQTEANAWARKTAFERSQAKLSEESEKYEQLFRDYVVAYSSLTDAMAKSLGVDGAATLELMALKQSAAED